MVRRNSSRFQPRAALRKSKSASSVGTRNASSLTTVEPSTACSVAHIAARLSFTKSLVESSENQRSASISASSSTYGLARSRSFMNGPDHVSCGVEKRGPAVDVAETQLCQKRSVRFTGPAALKKTDLATRAHETWTNHGCSSGLTHLDLFTAQSPKSSPSPRYDGFWLEEHSIDLNSRLETTVCGGLDPFFYPSPIHKLRKSRSMFTTSEILSDHRSDSSASGNTDWNPHELARQMAIRKENSSLRSPKSMSFLRTHAAKEASARGHSYSSLSTSPNKALLGGSTRLKSRPSMFFQSKNKQKSSLTEIRTSLRNSSSNSMPIPATISSTASSFSKATGLRNVARKVSRRMKSKFRGMFGRIKKQSETVDYTGNTEPSIRQQSQLSQLSLEEEASLSRVRSHVPSLRSVVSDQYLTPRQGNLEVVDDGVQQTDGERSRVTSWTNSSIHTVASTQDAEWESQRLSVIDEGGSNLQALDRWRSSEDEVRAYSALVQRLDDMQKQQILDAHSGDDTAAINCQSDMIESQLASHAKAKIEHRTFLNEEKIHEHASEADMVRQSRSRECSEVISPAGHLFRTHSPYRMALRQSMRVQNRSLNIKPPSVRYLSSLSALSLPTRRSSPNESDHEFHLSSAESVYSSLSDFHERDRDLDIQKEEPVFDHSTTVLTPCIYEASVASVHDELNESDRRTVSTASSVEWKTWLSAKVSMLEGSSQSCNALGGDEQMWNPWTVIGHVREDAEIEPTINPSDASDTVTNSPVRSLVTEEAALAPPLIQNIVLDDDVNHKKYTTLTFDENFHPALNKSGKQTDDLTKTTKINLGSVSSLSNSKGSVACEMACRGISTPQKRRTSPHTLNELRSNIKSYEFSAEETSSLQSSPGLSTAVQRQFGTIATGSPRRRSIRGGKEPTLGRTLRAVASLDNCQSRNGLDAQAMGSKRMVELFLSSRQAKRGARGQGDASEWFTAFL